MAVNYSFCPVCGNELQKKIIENRERNFCSKCGWIHYTNPLPVAVGVVVNTRGEILIARRNTPPGVGKWALPGGFIEAGETPAEACLRELHEEIGIEGNINALLGVYNRETQMYGQVLIIAYKVSVLNDTLVLNDEVQEANFFTTDSIPAIHFTAHRKIIDDFLCRFYNQ